MSPPARDYPECPPIFPPIPSWMQIARQSQPIDHADFLAGAALMALDPIARLDHPLGMLWRRRLALRCAAAIVRLNGRTEDEATLRDHWILASGGYAPTAGSGPAADPGPAGRILHAWRALCEPRARAPDAWPELLPNLLNAEPGDALTELITIATVQAKGQGSRPTALGCATTTGSAMAGSPLEAAAAVLTAAQDLAPDDRVAGLWLADAVLAHRLNWPAPVPLIAAAFDRNHCRVRARPQGGGKDMAYGLPYADTAATAHSLHAELARRAAKLLSVAPSLRAKDATSTVANLLSDDAHAARTGSNATARSSRRLFDRLIALGAVRELTGRPTFRLYGL